MVLRSHTLAFSNVVFGLSVNDVLNSELATVDRDLDVVDLFCGKGAIHKAATEQNLAAQAFDKFRVPGSTDTTNFECTEDIAVWAGFLRALQLVLRLRKGGLLMMGPPCSSFVQLNMAKCKRSHSNDYRGDETYEPVRLGNLLATITAFLMTLACLRDVESAVENPPGSVIWKLGILKQVLRAFGHSSIVTPRCAWSTEAFGKRSLKYFKFVATGGWIRRIRQKCRCPGRRHFLLTTVSFRNGRARFTGKKVALRQSAAYPKALGRRIVQAWQQRGDPCCVPRSALSRTSWLMPMPGSTSAMPACTSNKRRSVAEKQAQPKVSRPAASASRTSSAAPDTPGWLCPSPLSSMATPSQEPPWLHPTPCGSRSRQK